MAEGLKVRVVLSGVNFVEAGPLAVMQDALESLANNFPDCEIHALVHCRELFRTDGVTYHEYPEVKASWLRRLYFEYVQSRSISKEIAPYLWLSMHDITPSVVADVQAVYCHNPAPFYRMGWREALLSYKFTLFALLYRYLYGIGIRRNDYVIVQQDWMRRAFEAQYRPKKVVVAHPSVKHLPHAVSKPRQRVQGGEPLRFFYPAYSRSFKNMEVLLEAAQILQACAGPDSVSKFVLSLTIDGTENRYAQQLRQRFGAVRGVQWLGALPREEVLEQYRETDVMLFPSRLETWGMPLTEFKETGRPMLVADLPYAHETVGSYGAVRFLPPSDATAWATAMRDLCEGVPVVAAVSGTPIAQPYVENWRDLFTLLLSGAAASTTS